MSKGDRDKILAHRRKKCVKLGNGWKVGSYTSGNNKALKNLRKKNKKFKSQIKALKRPDGRRDYDSGNEDDGNDPRDAGDAFGGRKKKEGQEENLTDRSLVYVVNFLMY